MSDLLETNQYVFNAIWLAHKSNLKIYSSYSNPSGGCRLGSGYPEMETVYCFDGSNVPFIKAYWSEEIKGQRVHRYWFCINHEVDDE